MYSGVAVAVGLRLLAGVVEDFLWDALQYINCEQRLWCGGLRLRWLGLLVDPRHCGYGPVVGWLVSEKFGNIWCGGVSPSPYLSPRCRTKMPCLITP